MNLKILKFTFLALLLFSTLHSKHHSDLRGLKLICDFENLKIGFEFIDNTYFTEINYHKSDGFIEKKNNDYHYLSDKDYVYLERTDLKDQLYMRINRSSLFINDDKKRKCMVIKTPIDEFFKNLKKQQFN